MTADINSYPLITGGLVQEVGEGIVLTLMDENHVEINFRIDPLALALIGITGRGPIQNASRRIRAKLAAEEAARGTVIPDDASGLTGES